MSSNPQWELFQPPDSHVSSLQEILDVQHSNMQPMQVTRNGNFNNNYSRNSPRDNYNVNNTSEGNRYGMQYNIDIAPMGDAVGVYSSGSSNNPPQNDPINNTSIRETGIIEKLLHSYGFIQCCERQARLFFHFSQFSGNIDHLKIGDPVEFEMTYDRRTGKPIASNVSKIAPEVVESEARVTGIVTTGVKGEGSGDNTGRISYENRGECFFLPYTKDDVEGNVTLKSGDAVSFQIATNERGTLGACHVRFENPSHPVKYHGVVCSKKEHFGFIERADVVKEIFFHYSEAALKEELSLGDDVEFIIQTRHGKEVACNITKLPTGSVVFEDISPEITRGQVLKPLERGVIRMQTEPLPGRIKYRAADHSETEVPFGDKDQCGEFTLRHGDWVQFQVAIDRRDQLERATNISLLDESFNVSGERRDQGTVISLRNGFGFIRYGDRDNTIYFQFSEVLRLGQEISIGDEVEFTIDPLTSFTSTRQSAIRVKHLEPGTIKVETLVEKSVRGYVTKEAQPGSTLTFPIGNELTTSGVITYHNNNVKHTLPFAADKCESKMLPQIGDKVMFDIYQNKRSKELFAMSIQIQHSLNGYTSNVMYGFIAALKDNFGFIETIDHTKEIFFHFSNVERGSDGLELGMEVEYTLGRGTGSSGGCASAEYVRVLPRGTIPIPKPLPAMLNGTVTRTMRALNPDQPEYSGLIQVENGTKYEFGIMGLACKREIVQISDPVTFQADISGRATNIVPVRKKRSAIVDAIKGGFGFLSVEGEENRRLFFHMSEVRSNHADLYPGDSVEFVMLTNPRNGKSSACNVVKTKSRGAIPKPRPERLVARLRTISLEDPSTPRVIVSRTPRGPDGSRGFRPRRPINETLPE